MAHQAVLCRETADLLARAEVVALTRPALPVGTSRVAAGEAKWPLRGPSEKDEGHRCSPAPVRRADILPAARDETRPEDLFFEQSQFTEDNWPSPGSEPFPLRSDSVSSVLSVVKIRRGTAQCRRPRVL